MQTLTRKNSEKTWSTSELPKVKEHIDLGGSMTSASALFNISYNRWMNFIQTIPELKTLNEEYKEKIRRKSRFM